MNTGIVSGSLADLALHIHELEQRATTAERGQEQALQEAGRLRARVEELAAVARLVVEASACIDLLPAAEPGPVWAARVALGLDGATGERDINAEVAR